MSKSKASKSGTGKLSAGSPKQQWDTLQQLIVDCKKCPRLIKHCKSVAKTKRRAYADQEYWGRPVANFGKHNVPLLIVGLAPGAHGANRTGRMFTGDRSGDWLYRAMHKAGFANQAESVSLEDRLRLRRCTITGICHCAPPDNKPTPEEVRNCKPFLDATIQQCRPRIFLALGRLAWTGIVRYAIRNQWLTPPQPKFGHGEMVKLSLPEGSPKVSTKGSPKVSKGSRPRKTRWLVGCFHPSQQNTFTGRLTEPMIDKVFSDVNRLLDEH